MIPGKPVAILIDSQALLSRRNELKYLFWERFGIDSLNSTWEFDEPLCFATAAGMLIEAYAKEGGEIVAQCHEWIAGFAILYLKTSGAKVGTVFTTHATMLGRTIAGNGHALYEILDTIIPREWAYKYNVQDKHLTEVACARVADVFTTVSEITGLEAEKLLGRKPDVLLYNGFYTDRFPTFEETSLRHYRSRELLQEFLAYSFFPYYTFDLGKTLIFFTSGRYEFQNKGMDVTVEALAKLNRRLVQEKSERTIVMFFWVIMGRGSVRFDVLENKNIYHELKSVVEWQSKALVHKVILDFLSGHTPGVNDVFTSALIKNMQEDVRRIRRSGTPPLMTHDLDHGADPIVCACQNHGLLNRESDRVKIVLYPGYVDGDDGLLNIPYYDAIVGTHLGIFPSSYEPWGYTPLESAMLGVPAVTTDVAGFGKFICSTEQNKGVFVLERFKKSREETIEKLAQFLYEYALQDHAARVQEGFAAKTAANMCDWSNFIGRYFAAHELALKKV
jgi:glycogen(starch) synthase